MLSRRGVLRICLLAAAAGISGCGGPALRARSLPAEYRVAAKPANQRINLAGIAAPGSGQSRIDPGDLLELSISSGRDDEQPVPVLTRVSDSGSAEIPIIGQVQLAGLEPFEASQVVAAAAMERGIYRRPHVGLEIKSKCVNRITVMGAVETPGVHEIPRSSCDLVQALASAGGLTDEAGTAVEIIRQVPAAGAAVQPVSYQAGGSYRAPMRMDTVRVDLSSGTQSAGSCRLSDGDMVMVTPREKELVYVSGLVTKPGQFELPRNQETRLLDAVAMAGGASLNVADKVLIVRRVPGRPEPVAIQASIAGAKRNGQENLVIGPGDVVSVEETPATVAVDAFMKLIRFSVGVAGRTTVF